MVVAVACYWVAMPVELVSASEEPASVVRPSVIVAPPTLAITIDDLPFVNAVRPGDSRLDATGRILAALTKHAVPATGFVICDRVAGQESILAQWMDTGFELGNHSCSHPHLDRIDLDRWRSEVCSCSDTLVRITGNPVRWFRYPFLQTGSTVALRDAALAIVKACGHQVAPVSIDTGEWALVKPYIDAWREGDAALAGQVGDAYVTHLLAAIDHYQDIAEARFGRDVPHVLLLHANALAADYLDTLLTTIETRGFQFVSLAEALTDSVYALSDGYAGPIGLSWLYRVTPYMEGAWSWDNAEVDAFERRFGK